MRSLCRHSPGIAFMKNVTPLRIAITGFRHGHIFDLLDDIRSCPRLALLAMCEENEEASLMPTKGLKPTHRNFSAMLDSLDCDIIAIGDCYGRRGAQVIQALRAGRHVIADKPLCTSLDELQEIELLAHENNLRVGMMLDLRDNGNLIALRRAILSGRIGEVQTVSFSAQHSLLRSKRPSWYFEPEMHGGILNDIAIHAVDFIPWLTGLAIEEVLTARTWNSKAKGAPHFSDCGQLMLRLSNGGGVLGDVSYLAPDQCGHAIDSYWRITLHGTGGFAETSYNRKGVAIADDSDKEPEILRPAASRPGGYLQDFLADVAGNPREDGRNTLSCLRASRQALQLELKARNS